MKRGGISLTYTNYKDLKLKISKRYKNNPRLNDKDTIGFCGNWDGSRKNDVTNIEAFAAMVQIDG